MYYIKRSIAVTVFLFIAIFLLTAAFLIADGFDDKIQRSDVGIILGSMVRPDGVVSDRLAARLDKGLELYREGLIHSIIVSGGTGKEGINEAVVMKEYLMKHQVPDSSIIVDDQGNNTIATARNSVSLMRQYGFKSALIISQYFHISRTYLAFQQCQISPLYKAHANYFEGRDIYSITREVFGFYYYLLFHKNC